MEGVENLKVLKMEAWSYVSLIEIVFVFPQCGPSIRVVKRE